MTYRQVHYRKITQIKNQFYQQEIVLKCHHLKSGEMTESFRFSQNSYHLTCSYLNLGGNQLVTNYCFLKLMPCFHYTNSKVFLPMLCLKASFDSFMSLFICLDQPCFVDLFESKVGHYQLLFSSIMIQLIRCL